VPVMEEKILIPQLFKTEYSKIIAVLCKLFGLPHVEIAEDITNDTFLLAAETWGLKGIPSNPTAWLYTVAKNKTKDYLKRNQLFSEKITPALQKSQPDTIEIDLSPDHISDSQLQMIFVVCNPVISAEAQIGLALRILCGFGIEEIAAAFLTNKETINKRLLRAKDKLRTANIAMEMPGEKEMDQRLASVLVTLYLLFNEGYYSATQNQVLSKELCVEAMRLNYFLLQHERTNTPPVNALLSLMCFHASRLDARVNADGEHILYDEQNRDLWDEALIAKGNYFLIQSAQGQEISRYHLEASIAYWHCSKVASSVKWERILQLYNQLLQITYSPVTALNRTYALAQVKGKQVAIPEAEKLQLTGNHLYYSLLGNLYTDINNVMALQHYHTALGLAKTECDKNVITHYIKSF
jgi:RNA polymerase sigma factor (sigma-70 family)